MKSKRIAISAIKDPDLLAATGTMAKVKKVVEDRAIAAGSSVVTMRAGCIVKVSGSTLSRRRLFAASASSRLKKRPVRAKVLK